MLSTHLLAEVEEVCDRVLIIHKGRVVVYGTVAEVAARAAAPRAAQVRVPAEQSDRRRSPLRSRRAGPPARGRARTAERRIPRDDRGRLDGDRQARGSESGDAGLARGCGPELGDIWVAGRALAMMLAFSLLLSVTTYLVATNQALNFLEQREAVNLTLQIGVAVGALIVLLGAADALSGERERGTLESLLLTPVPRRDLVLGKGLAALSLWLGAFVVLVPYVWFIGRGINIVGVALLSGLAVGTLLAVFLAGLGLLVSALAGSNRMSLSISLFILLALYAPNQLPTGAQQGWAGDLILRIDPFSSASHYLGRIVVDGYSAGQDASWLLSPVIAAVLTTAGALIFGGRVSLRAGERP